MRLFVGCKIDQAVRGRLAEVIERLESSVAGVKWVDPEKTHITLKFLGEVENERLEGIMSSLERALKNIRPFTVSFEGLGCFSPNGSPRVLWVGISEGARELTALSGTAESALEPMGFEREGRAFSPHITLGRVRKGVRPRGAAEAVSGNKTTAFGSQRIECVSLIQSVLNPAGAVYTPVRTWDLF